MAPPTHRRATGRLAALLALAGVLLNPWTLAYVFSRDGTLEPITQVKIVALQLALIGAAGLAWRWRHRLSGRVLAVNAVVLAVLLALTEGVLLGLMQAPELLGTGRLQTTARALYDAKMHTIQYEPECAEHDPALGYRLRPGACTFANAEFEARVAINSLGLRDDEDDLVDPEIIVLGDSHAMGWGVEQHETFAERLEAITGRKTLNAATSSYGTVRALRRLRQLDTDSARVLIIQYCDNDHVENRTFFERGALPVMSAQAYDGLVAYHRQRTRYVFGEYLFRLVNRRLLDPPALALVRRFDPGYTLPAPWPPPPPADEEAWLFLYALRHSGVPLGGLRVIVLEINGYADNDGRFVAALGARLAETPVPGLTLETLDLAPLLTPAHYYRLDNHMRAAGHAVVAEALAARLRVPPPSAAPPL